jgi:hypothetical protein
MAKFIVTFKITIDLPTEDEIIASSAAIQAIVEQFGDDADDQWDIPPDTRFELKIDRQQ